MVAGGKGGPSSSSASKATGSEEAKDGPPSGMSNVTSPAKVASSPHYQQLTMNNILPKDQQQSPRANELAWKKVPEVQSHDKTLAPGSSGTGASELAVAPKEPPKPQKSPSLCNFGPCKKKINFLSFTCRCGGNYCVTHRCPEEHKCSFDFKNLATKELAKNNPKVVREKINRI